MDGEARLRTAAWQARAYRAVLVCYPPAFREEYAREMCLSFVDDCRAQRSWLGLLGVWSRALSDLALDAPKERMRMWWQDVRYGVRMLWKDRLTTLTAIIVLALGIGSTTAVFTLVNGLLLRPLPYAEPERLAMIDEFTPTRDLGMLGMTAPTYLDLRPRVRTVEDLALFQDSEPTIRDHLGADRVPAAYVSDGLWRLLRVQPLIGRTFTKDEDRENHPLVVVLGYDLWQRRYGGSSDILRRTLNIAGDPATVIGVMPPGFHFPQRAELWLPVRISVTNDTRTSYNHQVVARLAPGATLAQAEHELTGLLRQSVKDHPETELGQVARARPFHAALAGDYRLPALLLMAAVALVLLIACANVANLLLVKASIRAREMALRGALGAPRRRLIRQLLVESLLLGLFGTLAGSLVAIVALPAMLALIPERAPWIHFDPDFRVIAFVSGIAIATGLCVGIIPALTASRQNLVELLNEGGRGRTAGTRQRAIRNTLIVAEVALSMVLLTTAGIIARSFVQVSQQRLGYEPSSVLTFRTSVPPDYRDGPRAQAVVQRVRETLAALPGVTAVAGTTGVPLLNAWGRSLTVDGHPVLALRDAPLINHTVVTPGFFRAMGIPLVEGRDFLETDGTSPYVAIVDETLAQRYWPGESALGKRVRFGPPESEEPWHTVVGVAGRIRSQSLIDTERWDIYIPNNERLFTGLRYVVRTAGDPMALLPLVRERMAAIDRGIAVSELRPMTQVVHESIWRQRFFTTLLVVFALVALTLALVGLYGTVSYSVSQRRHELGVRAAMGASAAGLRWMITAQSVRLVAIGILLGGAASLGVRRVLASMLWVSASDPWLPIATAVALALVAAAASYMPARNATRVDPVSVLRE